MNYRRLYKKANRILRDKTPLKKDCGAICGSACCKGDEHTGMLLFPGEETVLPVIEEQGLRLAVCKGSCERSSRPLACRIFPYFFYADTSGHIKVVPDARGYGVCPLVREADKVKNDRGFLLRVKKAGRLLYQDEKCREFIDSVSREIDLINNLRG